MNRKVQCVVRGIICIREITGHTIARHTMERIISICRIDAILSQESRKLGTLAKADASQESDIWKKLSMPPSVINTNLNDEVINISDSPQNAWGR